MTKRWAWVLAAGLLVTAVGAQMVGPVSSLWATGSLPANAVLVSAGSGGGVKASTALSDNGTTLAYTGTIIQAPQIVGTSDLQSNGYVFSQSGLSQWSSAVVGWSATASFGALDSGFSRIAAGTAALGNGTAGSKNGNLQLAATTLTAAVFSGAGACASANEGTSVAVTDSTTNTWGATITGGGTFHVLAYCDGTAWTVAAK